MILNALRLMVEAMEALGWEWLRFCSRTRKIVSMATSVLPCRKGSSAEVKEETNLLTAPVGAIFRRDVSHSV